MTPCFLDTKILIYTRDQTSPKQATAQIWVRKLADEGRIVVSPQVLNEFARNVILKLRHIPLDAVTEAVDTLSTWCPIVMTAETTRAALALHTRYGYTIYDSANLCMAIDAGCGLFVTEDLQHRQEIAGMRILNPFEAELHELDVERPR